jgi:hypothetical protein
MSIDSNKDTIDSNKDTIEEIETIWSLLQKKRKEEYCYMIHYLFCNLTPFVRGSAGCSKVLLNACLLKCGLSMVKETDEFHAQSDWVALLSPTFGDYYEYKDKMFVKYSSSSLSSSSSSFSSSLSSLSSSSSSLSKVCGKRKSMMFKKKSIKKKSYNKIKKSLKKSIKKKSPKKSLKKNIKKKNPKKSLKKRLNKIDFKL